MVVAVGCSLLAFGCAGLPADQQSETQEIIDNLIQAGFSEGDITVAGGAVYVGRDAEVSLAASREMVATDQHSEEHYRTNNLIGASITKICINGATFTGAFSTALDLAIENYEQLPLRFGMARTPSTGCSFTINAVIQPGLVGGSAGFPSGGLPFSTITIGGGLSTFSVDTIEHVITHEIGHTIGFRHTDFFNRSISCGSGGNEGDGGVGAVHIPGTPTGASVGASIMNSCFRTNETGEFTGADLTALNVLYGPIAATLDFPVAFQANTTELWVSGPGMPGPTGLGMAAGTSPSFARLASGGFQVAFQANTGNLWTTGSLGTADLGFGMAAGTSPSITRLGGGFQIAFQATTGNLWMTGSAGTADLGLGMASGTSPSITAIGGGVQIAFQANTTSLWTTGVVGTADLGLGMAAGTSPSITTIGGNFQIAFQANTSSLWMTGVLGTANLGLGMAAGTSPSITTLGGSFQIAFQGNTTSLWTTGAAGTIDFGLGMRAGSSPSIAQRAGGGFNIAFQANTGNLWKAGTGGAGDMMLGMFGSTSPSTN